MIKLKDHQAFSEFNQEHNLVLTESTSKPSNHVKRKVQLWLKLLMRQRCGVETSTTATIIVAGVAPKMTFAEGTETSFVAESGNGCKCGSSCTCDPCNC
uniref:Metallothionein-like protein n=1 Tax=Lactuca sativa TaxID=4236 RepID=A0A9R1XDF4_LACSA|nr:hypothetical protein LSAT_V11C500291200 [Lactuca sativa]